MYLSPSLIMLVVFDVFFEQWSYGYLARPHHSRVSEFVRFPMMVMPFAAQAMAEYGIRGAVKYMALENCFIACYGYEANCRGGGVTVGTAGVILEKMRMMTKIVDKKLLLE